MMRGKFGLFVAGWVLILFGGLLAHLVQTSGGVRLQDVRYRGAGGERLSALLYVPPGATSADPAPAVLLSHGYINTREMQSPFAIELARRGFVVLAIDMAGHGYSEGAVGAHDGGGPDALRYLQSLPFVDRRNIGLEGHSMGGVPIVGAALAQPDGYRSMVLEGSTTPEVGQIGMGTPIFPHNVMLVFGQYDEFAPLMWHVAKGALIGRSPKLQRLFGSVGPVTAGRAYGRMSDGTARLLVTPPITHPIEHFSAAGVGASVDWFQQTLSGAATPKPSTDQIWLWKEIGTLVALTGFVALVAGAFQLLLATRFFGGLRRPAIAAAAGLSGRWWLTLVITAAIPALSFFPLMSAGFAFMPSGLFPEWVTNQLVVWVLGNAVITTVLLVILRQWRAANSGPWLLSGAIAILSVAVGYAALALSDALFKTDFRFWVVGLKPLDGRHLLYALAYLPAFTLGFLVMMKSLHGGLTRHGGDARIQYVAGAAALAGGFVALLIAQYASLMIGGVLINPDQALNVIIAIQFVPILAAAGLIGVFTWRRTGGYASGALICALVVTWYIVAGTATHWTPGWTLPKSAGLYPARPLIGPGVRSPTG